MNPLQIIEKYYDKESELYRILVSHSEDVTNKALTLASRHPELKIDTQFVSEAAMLHDIGIFKTFAPDICCDGTEAYICHGYLGSEIMEQEGFPRHAFVCERHTGTGISLSHIIEKDLPVPHRDMRPVSIEEQLICFADKFFSKTHLGEERDVRKARVKLENFGYDSLRQFDKWCRMFL